MWLQVDGPPHSRVLAAADKLPSLWQQRRNCVSPAGHVGGGSFAVPWQKQPATTSALNRHPVNRCCCEGRGLLLGGARCAFHTRFDLLWTCRRVAQGFWQPTKTFKDMHTLNGMQCAVLARFEEVGLWPLPLPLRSEQLALITRVALQGGGHRCRAYMKMQVCISQLGGA